MSEAIEIHSEEDDMADLRFGYHPEVEAIRRREAAKLGLTLEDLWEFYDSAELQNARERVGEYAPPPGIALEAPAYGPDGYPYFGPDGDPVINLFMLDLDDLAQRAAILRALAHWQARRNQP